MRGYMSRSRKVRNERGIALITVLLVALAVSSIALAAAMNPQRRADHQERRPYRDAE